MQSVMIAAGLAGIGYTLILLCLQSFHLGMLPSGLFGASLLAAVFIPPGWLRTLLIIHCLFWCLLFLISLAASLIGSARVAPSKSSKPGQLIILGYQLQHEQISGTLALRLDRARILAEQFPDAGIILSGGRPVAGPSEADVMAEYLEDAGIARGRMILEDSSGSSYENMVRCRELWDRDGCPETWAVTSSFHALRAYGSAKAAGLKLRVVSSSSPRFTYPAEIFREGILWIKTILFGYASMAWANGKL